MHGTTLQGISRLKTRFDQLRTGKDAILVLLEDAELPELVYNSNAIENSTLTLDETEKILVHQELPLHHSKREVFEAINLGHVTEYLREKLQKQQSLDEALTLFIHRTLLSHINERIAGRFRQEGEYVRVGSHIAPAPEQVVSLMESALRQYHDDSSHPLDRIIGFHLEFEHIHPFCDGNGRVGRSLLNYQLQSHGYPPIIIRNKEKKDYYAAIRKYDADRSTKVFEHIIALLLKESFHKRITYLESDDVVHVSHLLHEYPSLSPQSVTNAAKKQSLPAFRERGRWKVGRRAFEEWLVMNPSRSGAEGSGAWKDRAK